MRGEACNLACQTPTPSQAQLSRRWDGTGASSRPHTAPALGGPARWSQEAAEFQNVTAGGLWLLLDNVGPPASSHRRCQMDCSPKPTGIQSSLGFGAHPTSIHPCQKAWLVRSIHGLIVQDPPERRDPGFPSCWGCSCFSPPVFRNGHQVFKRFCF